MPDQTAQSHLDPHTVAAFAEHRLDAAARAHVEQHLAECAACRREVADVVRVLRPPSRTWPAGIVTLAAAAAIVVMVVLQSGTDESVIPAVRNGGEDGNVVQIVAPDTASVPGDEEIRFIWRSVGAGARYQFTLADESGSRIFSTGSPDTVLVLPDSVRLDRERTYQWFVDALRPDGGSVTSGVKFLRTGR